MPYDPEQLAKMPLSLAQEVEASKLPAPQQSPRAMLDVLIPASLVYRVRSEEKLTGMSRGQIVTCALLDYFAFVEAKRIKRENEQL